MASIKVFMTNEDKEKKIVGTQTVAKKLSKKLVSKDGTIIYFIEKDHGVKRGFMSRMKFANEHPLDGDYCEIELTLDRT